MTTKTVNIAFQEDLLNDIDRVAKKEARSRSALLREAVRAYIRRRQRWTHIFALGRKFAVSKDLKPEDIRNEIKAYRKEKKKR